MLHIMVKCGWMRCRETFDQAKFPRKQFCSRKCQLLTLHQLEQHTEVIHTVAAVNKLGAGMALVSSPTDFDRLRRTQAASRSGGVAGADAAGTG